MCKLLSIFKAVDNFLYGSLFPKIKFEGKEFLFQNKNITKIFLKSSKKST